jgi:hypothetical protein
MFHSTAVGSPMHPDYCPAVDDLVPHHRGGTPGGCPPDCVKWPTDGGAFVRPFRVQECLTDASRNRERHGTIKGFQQ